MRYLFPLLIIAVAVLLAAFPAQAQMARKPASLDVAIGLVDKAEKERTEALSKASKAETQAENLKSWGVGQWQRAEDEKGAKEKYRASRLTWAGGGFALGSLVFGLIGLAVGSGVISRFVPEKKPSPADMVAIPVAPAPAKCNLPSAGWECSREAGHEWPCAVSPIPPVVVDKAAFLASPKPAKRSRK